MKIEPNELKGTKKDIYSHLWGNKELDFQVQLTGKTDLSYEMLISKDIVDMVGKQIAENFNLACDDFFKSKFTQACSGSGDEIKKIATLHSSSLCAFLFFYNVSEGKPLKLGNYKFTESFFEFKNKVIGYPSNVDVVLVGTEKMTGRKVLLFLESKFSEYITGITKGGNKFEIGKSYFTKEPSKSIYEHFSELGINRIEQSNCLTCPEDCYIEGLKQMVSHYFGLCNFVDGDQYEKNNKNLLDQIKKHKGGAKIILGEIIFDNFGDNIKKDYLVPYEKKFKKLAPIMNDIDTRNIEILETPFHYSDLKNISNINDSIRKFYFGE